MSANQDIAIIGFSFKMPQGAENETSLWEVLEQRRNLMTEWPESRLNMASFHHDGDSTQTHKLRARGAHFLQGDPAVFDAPFFSISAKEAAAMDPQQRMTLETSYRAFENAGIPIHTLRGSRTGVFSASMTDDYARMLAKDPDTAPAATLTGNTPSILPNRLSWYYDLSGPSVHVDTACSSSLTALDLACQYIRDGEISSALITSSNLILGPEGSLLLSNLNFLSPDSLCRSFDDRANGYARGEGVVSLILKPLADAVRDQDCIRAVIRASGMNQDGRTPTMVQPGLRSQAALIERVYAKAGLDLGLTRYVEAHGTGTAVGDPIEVEAIGRVFGQYRSSEEPLYVGSIKANTGHLEASSGLAGVIKAIMILEKGIIPPNALYEKPNRNIDHSRYHTKIPVECTPWPAIGLRRASVNSFGFGGANVHVVLDDAFHRLRELGLTANHRTNVLQSDFNKEFLNEVASSSPSASADEVQEAVENSAMNDRMLSGNGNSMNVTHHLLSSHGGDESDSGFYDTASSSAESELAPRHRLLVFTAADEKALKRVTEGYTTYLASPQGENTSSNFSARLEYTLAVKRTHLPWRTFAITTEDDTSEASLAAIMGGEKDLSKKATRASGDQCLAFAFTGQGAQYPGMGLDLASQFAVYRQSIEQMDRIYGELGCPWSIMDELQNPTNIHRPDYSQPLNTALQIALVDLFRSFGISPKAVVGHSSGEIAAAYCVGALAKETACRVSYFRGKLAGELRDKLELDSQPGAMMSVNLSADGFVDYLRQVIGLESDLLHIACVNSPSNITISGPEVAVDILKAQLDEDGIFSQKLKTGIAYHSPAMRAIGAEYVKAMGPLQCGLNSGGHASPAMVSSVTGQIVPPSELAQPQYWERNLVSQVKFSTAIQELTDSVDNPITDIIEIGPHGALRRPIRDTLQASSSSSVRYHSVLDRSAKSAAISTLTLIGTLFASGHQMDLKSVVATRDQDSPVPPLLANLPEYPFDKTRTYWAEPRMSRDYRLRGGGEAGEVLGARCHDWNPKEPRWRKLLSTETTPWTADHAVTKSPLYPAAAMLVMTMEAIREMAPPNRTISFFHFKEARFLRPIPIATTAQDQTEVLLRLRPLRQDSSSKDFGWSDAKILARVGGGEWDECFHAEVQLHYDLVLGGTPSQVDGGREMRLVNAGLVQTYRDAVRECDWPLGSEPFYEFHSTHGLQYEGPFRGLEQIRWDRRDTAVGVVRTARAAREGSQEGEAVVKKYALGDCLVHPAVLDMAFQLGVARMSQGLTVPTPTMVPQAMFDARISATGWPKTQQRDGILAPEIGYVTKVTSSAGGRKMESEHVIIADNDSPLCSIRKLVMSTVSSSSEDEDDLAGNTRPNLLYQTQWKPQLSLMSPTQLQEACQSGVCSPDDPLVAEYRARLGELLDDVLLRAVSEILPQLDIQSSEDGNRVMTMIPPALEKYVAWIRHAVCQKQRQSHSPRLLKTEEQLEITMKELEEMYPDWSIFVAVARNLPAILSGEQNPLQILFETNLAESMYGDLFSRVCDHRFETLLDLTAHEKPNQRILEVGAGTGGFTSVILPAFRRLEERNGGSAFSEYVFSDLSASFFEQARSRFSGDSDNRITYKTLDLERPGAEQDFVPGSFDVIFAGCVLHATRDLNTTIRNVRSLLKPGGKLVIFEVIDPDDVAINFGFGIMPGWWLASEEWRTWCPNVTDEGWNRLLRENGFSGNDVVLRDTENDKTHLCSIMVSTAVAEPTLDANGAITAVAKAPQSRTVIVVDEDSEYQQGLSSLLQTHIAQTAENGRLSVEVMHFGKVLNNTTPLSPEDQVVSLVEAGQSFLAGMTENHFEWLKSFVGQVQNLIWVSSTTSEETDHPDYSMAKGFLRSMRGEAIDKRIITLSIEGHMHQPEQCVSYIDQILRVSFDENNKTPEVEYVGQKGQLLTWRTAQMPQLEQQLKSHTSLQTTGSPWLPGPPLVLTVRSPGMLDTLEFIEDADPAEPLGVDDVEIEAKAWGLSFRDVFAALGRLNESDFGYDCAGYVTRVGSGCRDKFEPGDRVYLARMGCMRTYPRAHADSAIKIPSDLSFEAAASVLTPGVTAYHSLVEVARLRKGEKILIHSAAGSTGQLAIWIAKMVGAEIFATVGLDDKKDFLMREFSIPADHIFYSRDTTFAHGVMRMTGGRGIDVVLNSISGDGLRASWECLAPYGRFIELGKADIIANSSLPMASFSGNRSFMAVDVRHIALTDQSRAQELMSKVVTMLSEGLIGCPRPLHLFPVSDVEGAFRYMQSGKNTGRIIITMQPSDVVPKRILQRCDWSFKPDASYLVCGGLGGIGRAVLQWMVGKGVKNLIVPSRSGPRSQAAKEVVADMKERGVHVWAPECDASSLASLQAMLNEATSSSMPPIRGCINAAMVLQDAVFENMTYAQWDLTIRSKAHTAWNLHQCLSQELDFFVLFSSLGGLYGNIAQSNYAAGCAYQDAVARYRSSRGQTALSLDIGWMRTVGIIAENEQYGRHRLHKADMGQIETEELLALLDIYCDPAKKPTLANDPAESQVLIGAITGADVEALGLPPNPVVEAIVFSRFAHQVNGNKDVRERSDDGGSNDDPADLFRHGIDKAQRAKVVVQALTQKLARALMISVDDVEPSNVLSDYGVDSLMAVELRNWIRKDFAANVTVFDMMSGASIKDVGMVVAEKTDLPGSTE